MRHARAHPELVTVVIPIRNGEAHIASQLTALVGQTYGGPWELVVVDNGCNDRSVEIVESFRDRVPSLTVVRDPVAGLARARNSGARAARGELLAYCDADDEATAEWLEELVSASTNADIVGGRSDYEALNSTLQRAWRPSEPMTELYSPYGFLPFASGGNCAVWADVAHEIRWDESFEFGATDIEFSWRAQLAGYRIAFAPGAVMHIRYRAHPRSIARQYFRSGTAEPYLYRRFRESGMQPSELRDALHDWRWLVRRVRHLRSAELRGNWLRVAGKHAGRLYGSIRWRALYL